jgi:prepilin-type N-terminal cleavage/methylation domain-containing protein
MNRRDQRRGGFSLIELLMAVSIVGILAGLAIPNLRNVTWRARATEVAGDIEVVRVSTNQFNADRFAWPLEVGQGVIPADLDEFLPEGFSFQGDGYELDFERLSPVVVPGDPNTTQLIAVAVVIETDELSNAVVELLGNSILYSVGRKHTFIIDRS